jgi:hypothetical protein
MTVEDPPGAGCGSLLPGIDAAVSYVAVGWIDISFY